MIENNPEQIGSVAAWQNILNGCGYTPKCLDLVIAAHSSGSFVAHEFLSFFVSQTDSTIVNFTGKTTYINLDGGGSGLKKEFTDRLKKTIFACAVDSTTGSVSANSIKMKSLVQQHKNSMLLELDASNSGCHKDAKWCLHDTMINQVPHNHNHFDLENDYQDFSSDHPVSDFYLDGV